MDTNDVIALLNELIDEQVNQVTFIVEEIIDEFPYTANTFVSINSERDILWLNDELKILGLNEKE